MSRFLILFDLIGELARRRHQTGERYFSGLGLSHSEARLLSLLHQMDGAAAQDTLSSGLSVDRSNAVRALQRLEHDGYVLRRKDRADQRANLVQMTPKGRKAVAEIARLRKKMAHDFFGTLTETEAGMIADLLAKALASQSEEKPGGTRP